MNIIYDKNIILEKLTSAEFFDFISKFQICSVILFGSICSDEFHELSDVDIAVLGEDIIPLDDILDIELFLEGYLEREIDVIDLKNENIDLFLKINILNNGKVIYTNDENKVFNNLCDDTDRIYRENENYMYFRKLDVLS
ncbi:MAG: nucleotidyltransferase family protein [Clostridiaceae bacterium]